MVNSLPLKRFDTLKFLGALSTISGVGTVASQSNNMCVLSLIRPAAIKTLSDYFLMHPGHHARKGLICQFQRFYRSRCPPPPPPPSFKGRPHPLMYTRTRCYQATRPHRSTTVVVVVVVSAVAFNIHPLFGLESFCSPTGVSYRVVRP